MTRCACISCGSLCLEIFSHILSGLKQERRVPLSQEERRRWRIRTNVKGLYQAGEVSLERLMRTMGCGPKLKHNEKKLHFSLVEYFQYLMNIFRLHISARTRSRRQAPAPEPGQIPHCDCPGACNCDRDNNALRRYLPNHMRRYM